MTNDLLANELGDAYQAWLGSFYNFESNIFVALKSSIWEAFFNYDLESSYNPVLWTMEIELLGSFFLFGFLSVLGKHRSRIFFYGMTAVVAAILDLHWINAFTFGMALCDLYINKEIVRSQLGGRALRILDSSLRSVWFFVIFSLITLLLAGSKNYLSVLNLFLAVGMTGFVMVNPIACRLFSISPFVFLGKISFGLYLIHFPIICSTAYPIYSASMEIFDPFTAKIVSSFIVQGDQARDYATDCGVKGWYALWSGAKLPNASES